MVQVILEFLLSENKQRMLSECEMFSFRQCLLPQKHFFLFLQTLVVCCGQNAVIFFIPEVRRSSITVLCHAFRVFLA